MTIDAQYPKDGYENLQQARNMNDYLELEQDSIVESLQINREHTLKKMEKYIHEPYLYPPNKTNIFWNYLLT